MSDGATTTGTSHFDLKPRSQLLSALFDRLNADGVTFVVMNNYEELPWVIPSDVDITVPPEFFARLDRFILDFAAERGALIVQKLWHGNQKCAYILGVGRENAREFIQFDFFVGYSTKGCPALLSHAEMIAGHRALRNFFTPAPAVEALFIGMRRLFKNDWSKRHCARVAELRAQITSDNWVLSRYAFLEETLERAAVGDLSFVASRRSADWAELRRRAKANLGIPGLLANVALQSRRIARRLNDETGFIVVVDGPGDLVDAKGTAHLEFVFHRHLRLDERELADFRPLARIALPVRLALLKRRKGLLFLHVGAGQTLSRALARSLDRLRLVDLRLSRLGEAADVHLNAPRATATSSAETVEVIVRRQAEKTACSIERSRTQTSG